MTSTGHPTDQRRASAGSAPTGGAGATPSTAPHGIGARKVAAELGVLALALGTTVGFNRLFLGWGFLRTLVPLAVGAWLVPLVLRRLRVRVGLGLALHLAIGVLVLTVRFAPGTHLLGVPTPTTLRTLGRAIDASFAEFADLVAPVAVSDGFLLVVGAALWIFGFFADTAAVRYRGPVQAAIPHVTLFVTLGVLARSAGRTTALVWFGLGLATYAVTQRARIAAEQRWVEGHARPGRRAVALAASASVVAAVLAGLVVAPTFPGSHVPVVDLRDIGRGPGPRTVVSPFVGLRSLLGERSDQVVFTVEADAPSYWRLTALEEFDPARQIWVSSGTYSNAGDVLPETRTDATHGTVLRQDVEIEGLGGPWLPAAFVPRRIESGSPIGFDRRSASIITRNGDDRPERYRLESVVPDYEAALDGPRDGGRDDAEVDPVHLQVPTLSREVERALADAVTGSVGSVQQMLFLQNWFRTRFAYDEDVDYSAESDPLVAFLEQRRGFCQQFASAFALMARALGHPSRIAVGFTPGDLVVGEGGRSRYVVRGRHAHAWPEVHFPGVGWVPFEPTPQRGDPQSRAHTGIAPAQAAPPANEETAATTPRDPSPTTSLGSPTTTRPGDVGRSGEDDLAVGADPDRGGGGAAARTPVFVALATLLGAALVAVAVAVLRRRRRGAGHGPPSGPERAAVADAWSEALRSLRRIGVRPDGSETPRELAARVPDVIRPWSADAYHSSDPELAARISAVDAAMARLAEAETRARYRAGAPTAEEAATATRDAAVVREHAVALTRARRHPVAAG